MMRRIDPDTLQRWYRLLDEPMLDFDCGTLCAPHNDGVPWCCDPECSVPLLLRAELAMHRTRDNYWKPMRARTAWDRQLAKDSNDADNVLCLCAGHDRCERDKRALVCRTFPFEPHVDGRGEILGLTYIHRREIPCPLYGRRRLAVNPAYVRNAIVYWREVFALYPDERELYIGESRNCRRRHRRRAERVPLFVSPEADTPAAAAARRALIPLPRPR